MGREDRVELVFGYGSLAAGDASPAHLRGFRRTWGVAMDNRVAIGGYKVWETAGGERPALTVCFLDVEPAPHGGEVTGAVLPVADAAALAALDARERNYARIDVTAHVEWSGGLRVWVYVGRPEARGRAAAGRAAGEAVVARTYLDGVQAGFAALGLPPVEAPDVPVRELRRVDLPPDPAGRPASVRSAGTLRTDG